MEKTLHFAAGQRQRVVFKISPKQMEWWDEGSQSMSMIPGDFELLVGGGSDGRSLKPVAFRIR
ncbi:fibronectin type III-like domain-contianing protein [Parapedobacter deserti]|uniref:Fibronectin type III-like domain-contianing protein n=1 Tax=Parapedobacter deserti TaxID=1912957 RepID=A0ABV7JN23_9SPHI